MTEKWHRLECLIGKENLSILNQKSVLIVGLGGVGGYVVEGLIRSGVSHLTVVDSDVVDVTNLNRQIIALEENIGKEKATLIKERALSIQTDAFIDSKILFVDDSNIEEVFDKKYDYVVDACDTIATKKLLIEKCMMDDIPIISCMGTARKLDPTKLEIVDIRKTSYDPLAKVIRGYMKKNFPNKKLLVLSSTEAPKKMEGDTLASCIFVPAVAGLFIANYIIRDFIQ